VCRFASLASGEAIEDLQPFVARDFVAALLGLDAADGRA